jgi:hypothetical protein
MALIVIDPGHGGDSRIGNSSPLGVRGADGTLEHAVNYALAERVQRLLGPGAILTRPRNGNRSLGARAAFARERGAGVFVSLHAHGGAGPTEAWVHSDASDRSLRLAEAVSGRVAARFGGRPPVRRAELAVLHPRWHAPDTAACLLETDALRSGGRDLDALAASIADGLRGYCAQGGRLGSTAPMARSLAAAPLAWTPVRADEIDATSSTDRFAGQTFELTVPLLTSAGAAVPTPVSVFLPRLSVNANFIKVHVFFSPGDATESGLSRTPGATSTVGFNAVMMHGLRGSTDASDWIMIGVPGADPGFVTMDAAGVAACLSAVNDDAPYSGDDIGALRLSCHSRGARGLAQTIQRGLLPAAKIDRVVVFDSVGAGPVNAALASAGIPGSKQFAYQVNDPTLLSAAGATNVALNSPAMRAIGYSRLIADAAAAAAVIGETVPPFSGTLLPLPVRGSFTTRSAPPASMTDIRAFTTANAPAIAAIVRDELKPAGMKTYVDANNLTRLFQASGPFGPGIMSHHLFVAELAHEIVD